jgi:hypothetical protein
MSDQSNKAEEHGPRSVFELLHERCDVALDKSFDVKFDALNGASYGLSTDLDLWNKALSGRAEKVLFASASNEYVLALLNNSQAQYRNAFKSLRLVLELTLQGLYLSAHLVTLNEWLTSHADTSWATLMDNEKGVFSRRYCRAFFPELIDNVGAFKGLSETLYREMSECTHGNVPNRIPLPNVIEFHEETFKLWHEKAETLRYVINFVLTLRYYNELNNDLRAILEPVIIGQLNHIEVIRQAFGGPSSS